MHSRFHPLSLLSREIQRNFKFHFTTQPITYPSDSQSVLSGFGSYMVEVSKFRSFSVGDYQRGKDLNFDTFTVYDPKPDKTDREPDESPSIDNDACTYQNLLKFQAHKPTDEIQRSLEQSSLSLNDDLVISVLQRHRSDWKPAYVFFNWVSGGRNGSEHFPGSDAYNEILDILGRMNRFQEYFIVFHFVSCNRAGAFIGVELLSSDLEIGRTH
ncbi:hypothetical protein C3L33_10006, partial [Rhododendron williamsianum]